MKISIASGKGGTGKTTVAINLALSLTDVDSVKFWDCDVEEPNAHFFLHPQIRKTQPVSVFAPEIIDEKCTYCGKCAEICEYNALAVLKDTVLVFDELCHSCRGCKLLCPEKAIQEKMRRIGVLEFGRSGQIEFVHGRLDIGQVMSPPLIKAVKNSTLPQGIIIIDCPPGTSCPVIEAVKGSDFSLLVTEPTPFGFNDLQLAAATLEQMNIPCGVVLNRTGPDFNQVQEFCAAKNIPILMTIPLDRRIAVAYSEGTPLINVFPEYKQKFQDLFSSIKKSLLPRGELHPIKNSRR